MTRAIDSPAAPAQPHEAQRPSDAFAASLPLDWDHHPADAAEGWEMLVRAGARYRQLEHNLTVIRESFNNIAKEGLKRADEADSLRADLAAAIERERLANMRADQAEEARDAALNAARGRSDKSEQG